MVQAKTTKHFGKKWSRSIDRSTILFWLNQLLPVFMIVNDLASGTFYWMSIEENREILVEKMKPSRKTVHISVDRSRTLGIGGAEAFMKQVEKDWDSAVFRLDLMQGTPRFRGEGYVKSKPIICLPQDSCEDS